MLSSALNWLSSVNRHVWRAFNRFNSWFTQHRVYSKLTARNLTSAKLDVNSVENDHVDYGNELRRFQVTTLVCRELHYE